MPHWQNRRTGKKPVWAPSAEKMLIYAPLLRWYVAYGAVIKAVQRTIDYEPRKIFTWFMEQVTAARHTEDVKRLGNSLLNAPLQLSGGGQVLNPCKAGESFFGQTNRSAERRCRRFSTNRAFFDCVHRFFPHQPRGLSVECRNNLGKPSHPHLSLPALRQLHLERVLVTEQPLRKRALESLNNGLVAVNFGMPPPDGCPGLSIARVTAPMNLHPGSTCSSLGHFRGPRAQILLRA